MATPSDYTICVKNIPFSEELNAIVDYKQELTAIFQNYDSSSNLNVSKVNLVYNIEELIEKEKEIDQIIEEKRKIIIQSNYDFLS